LAIFAAIRALSHEFMRGLLPYWELAKLAPLVLTLMARMGKGKAAGFHSWADGFAVWRAVPRVHPA
jgi:hypothetical protein